MESGTEQYGNYNLYVYAGCWSMRDYGNPDGDHHATDHTNVHASRSDL
jgi:hypothetical protein